MVSTSAQHAPYRAPQLVYWRKHYMSAEVKKRRKMLESYRNILNERMRIKGFVTKRSLLGKFWLLRGQFRQIFIPDALLNPEWNNCAKINRIYTSREKERASGWETFAQNGGFSRNSHWPIISRRYCDAGGLIGHFAPNPIRGWISKLTRECVSYRLKILNHLGDPKLERAGNQ